MRLTSLLLFGVLIFGSFISQANETGLPVKSVVLAEAMTKYMPGILPVKQSLELAYERLGISVEWLSLPSGRALKYTNEGRFDGEFLRAESVVNEGYSSLIKVPVALVSSDIHLYCLREVFCQPGGESLKLIGYNINIKYFKMLCSQLKLNCIGFYPSKITLEALLESRVDAFIATEVEIAKGLDELSPLFYQSEVLGSIEAFHYLHKKLESLVPSLTEELNKLEHEGLRPNLKEQAKNALEKTGKIIPVSSN